MSQPQKCHKTESNKRKVDRLDVSTVVESPTKKSHQEDKTAKVLADKNEWKYVKNCLDTGWISSSGRYVNQFDGSGGYTGGYAAGAATKDGPQMTGLVTDDSGSSLNTFSNYDDGTHNGGNVETNIFREHGAAEGFITSEMFRNVLIIIARIF